MEAKFLDNYPFGPDKMTRLRKWFRAHSDLIIPNVLIVLVFGFFLLQLSVEVKKQKADNIKMRNEMPELISKAVKSEIRKIAGRPTSPSSIPGGSYHIKPGSGDDRRRTAIAIDNKALPTDPMGQVLILAEDPSYRKDNALLIVPEIETEK